MRGVLVLEGECRGGSCFGRLLSDGAVDLPHSLSVGVWSSWTPVG